MEPLSMFAVGASIAGPILGGLAGRWASSGDREAAKKAAMLAYEELLKVGMPPDLSREIIFKEFKKVGDLTPEMEQHIDVGISEVSQIKEDPKLRDAQLSALQILQQKGQTGFSPQDRSALNQVRDEVQRDAEAKRQQIVQNFQSRGMGGAGAELMAHLQQAQGSSNQASMEGDRIAADASQRALQALTQGAALGGQMRQQDFGVAQAKASAADEFQRFNVQNQIARQQRNVASKNAAQEYNLGQDQRVSDMNTQMTNAERLRQSQAQRDYWNDQMKYSTHRANAHLGQASVHQDSADRTAQMYQGIGSGLGAAAGQYANYKNSQTQTVDQKVKPPEPFEGVERYGATFDPKKFGNMA